jgi:hypothetical protein
MWEMSRHPLLAVLLAGLISIIFVPRVVNRYQVNGKIMEFRFQLFREASVAYNDLMAAAWHLLTARANSMMTVDMESTKELHETLERKEVEFDEYMKVAMRTLLVMPTLFSKRAQEGWGKTIRRIQQFRFEPGLKAGRAILDDAIDLQSAFAVAAAKEIPLPYVVAVLVEPDEIKKTRDEVEKTLQEIANRARAEKEKQDRDKENKK